MLGNASSGPGSGDLMRILFLIRQMNEGGAQRQLYELARGMRDRGNIVSVITFYHGGRFEEILKSEPDVTYICLNKSGRFDNLPFFLRLLRTIRDFRPDILHGYLTGANLFSILLRPFLPRTRVVWGIRNAGVVALGADRHLARVEKFAARFAHLLIANSAAGKDFCLRNGVSPSRIAVVHNGIDTGMFRPNPEARSLTRSALGIPLDMLVVGIVGRLAANKDHETFLKAAAIFSAKHPNARFVIVGSGPLEAILKRQAEVAGLNPMVTWVGSTAEIQRIYPAFDMLVSSSVVEGFANVIAEAMACGVPVVATDVGDSAVILGETGVVIPPRSPGAIAQGMEKLLSLLGPELSAVTRARILSNFTLSTLAERTEHALSQVDP